MPPSGKSSWTGSAPYDKPAKQRTSRAHPRSRNQPDQRVQYPFEHRQSQVAQQAFYPGSQPPLPPFHHRSPPSQQYLHPPSAAQYAPPTPFTPSQYGPPPGQHQPPFAPPHPGHQYEPRPNYPPQHLPVPYPGEVVYLQLADGRTVPAALLDPMLPPQQPPHMDAYHPGHPHHPPSSNIMTPPHSHYGSYQGGYPTPTPPEQDIPFQRRLQNSTLVPIAPPGGQNWVPGPPGRERMTPLGHEMQMNPPRWNSQIPSFQPVGDAEYARQGYAGYEQQQRASSGPQSRRASAVGSVAGPSHVVAESRVGAVRHEEGSRISGWSADGDGGGSRQEGGGDGLAERRATGQHAHQSRPSSARRDESQAAIASEEVTLPENEGGAPDEIDRPLSPISAAIRDTDPRLVDLLFLPLEPDEIAHSRMTEIRALEHRPWITQDDVDKSKPHDHRTLMDQLRALFARRDDFGLSSADAEVRLSGSKQFAKEMYAFFDKYDEQEECFRRQSNQLWIDFGRPDVHVESVRAKRKDADGEEMESEWDERYGRTPEAVQFMVHYRECDKLLLGFMKIWFRENTLNSWLHAALGRPYQARPVEEGKDSNDTNIPSPRNKSHSIELEDLLPAERNALVPGRLETGAAGSGSNAQEAERLHTQPPTDLANSAAVRVSGTAQSPISIPSSPGESVGGVAGEAEDASGVALEETPVNVENNAVAVEQAEPGEVSRRAPRRKGKGKAKAKGKGKAKAVAATGQNASAEEYKAAEGLFREKERGMIEYIRSGELQSTSAVSAPRYTFIKDSRGNIRATRI